jgi:hypothetical protein
MIGSRVMLAGSAIAVAFGGVDAKPHEGRRRPSDRFGDD